MSDGRRTGSSASFFATFARLTGMVSARSPLVRMIEACEAAAVSRSPSASATALRALSGRLLLTKYSLDGSHRR